MNSHNNPGFPGPNQQQYKPSQRSPQGAKADQSPQDSDDGRRKFNS